MNSVSAQPLQEHKNRIISKYCINRKEEILMKHFSAVLKRLYLSVIVHFLTTGWAFFEVAFFFESALVSKKCTELCFQNCYMYMVNLEFWLSKQTIKIIMSFLTYLEVTGLKATTCNDWIALLLYNISLNSFNVVAFTEDLSYLERQFGWK